MEHLDVTLYSLKCGTQAGAGQPGKPEWAEVTGQQILRFLETENGSPDSSTASPITRSSLRYEILESGSKTAVDSMPCFLNKGAGSMPLSSICRQKLEIDDAKIDKLVVLLCPDS